MSIITTVQPKIENLKIFKNGLLSELQALAPLRNDLKKKESDVKTKELSIIDSLAKKLASEIVDPEIRKVFLLKTSEKQPSLLHELVAGCLSFGDDVTRPVNFCKKPMCFFAVETAGDTIINVVDKMNKAAEAFKSTAHFHAENEIGQVCFSFSLH